MFYFTSHLCDKNVKKKKEKGTLFTHLSCGVLTPPSAIKLAPAKQDTKKVFLCVSDSPMKSAGKGMCSRSLPTGTDRISPRIFLSEAHPVKALEMNP